MDARWNESAFVDFGADPFYPYKRGELPRIAADDRTELQKLVRRTLPRRLACMA